jgi:hypothetical protein
MTSASHVITADPGPVRVGGTMADNAPAAERPADEPDWSSLSADHHGPTPDTSADRSGAVLRRHGAIRRGRS